MRVKVSVQPGVLCAVLLEKPQGEMGREEGEKGGMKEDVSMRMTVLTGTHCLSQVWRHEGDDGL